MTLQESGEMYLKTIFQLSEKKDIVRAIDVAQSMGFSKPSVSRAMKNLSTEGYLEIDHKSGGITLLPPGLEIAKSLNERQLYLEKAFVHVGVSPETAAVDACKIEHVISKETFMVLKQKVDDLSKDMAEEQAGSSRPDTR